MMPFLISVAVLAGVAVLLFLWEVVVKEFRAPRVICLMYHRLASPEDYANAPGTEQIFTLPTDEFERQIIHLKERGYTFATAAEFQRYVTGDGDLKAPAVFLTFDDGCRSVMTEAEPILRKHGAKGTVFVTTDPDAFVFREGGVTDPRMTDDELRELDGEVVQCESHCVSHRPLSQMPAAEMRRELADSRAELERICNRPIQYLAIPGNWFDRRVMRTAREVGYEAVWFSFPGATRRGASVWGLPRINVEGIGDLAQFEVAMSPVGIIQRRMVSLAKRLPGRILGPRLWLPIRKIILACIPGGYISTRRITVIFAFMAVCLMAVIVYFLMRGN